MGEVRLWPGEHAGFGVFRHLVHRVGSGGHSIDFQSVRLHVAECGAVCVVLADEPTTERTPCTECFGND